MSDVTVAIDTVVRDAGAALLGGVIRLAHVVDVKVSVLQLLLLQQNSQPTSMTLPPVSAGVHMSRLVAAQLRVVVCVFWLYTVCNNIRLAVRNGIHR